MTLTPQEMSSIQSSIDRVADEEELQELMGRIKRDIKDREQDDEICWTAEQAQQARNWCRAHREYLRQGDDVMTKSAMIGPPDEHTFKGIVKSGKADRS